MNRIMVALGFGSVVLMFCGTMTSATAEQQHLVVNSLTMPGDAEISWHDSLESGWQVSKATGRPMVIFITSDRCTYCDAMKMSTWCESSIRDRVGNGFVAIRLKQGRNEKSLSRVEVDVYPTTLIGSPEGKVVAKRLGFQPPGSLHQLLSEASNRILARRQSNSPRRQVK